MPYLTKFKKKSCTDKQFTCTRNGSFIGFILIGYKFPVSNCVYSKVLMYLSVTFIYQVTTNRAILFVIITYQCLFCASDLTTLSLMQIYIKWHSGDEEMLAQHRRMLFWRTRECSHLTIKKIFVIIVSPRKVLSEIA